MPRPQILDDAKRQVIIALVSAGCSRTVAAGYVGCASSTIRYTAAHDPAFDEQLRQAAVRPLVWHLQNIRKHAERSWKASAWMLERLYPHQFGRRKPEELSREDIHKSMQEVLKVIEDIEDDGLYRELIRRVNELSTMLDAWASEHAAPWERGETLEPTDAFEVSPPKTKAQRDAEPPPPETEWERLCREADEWAAAPSTHPQAADNPDNLHRIRPDRRHAFSADDDWYDHELTDDEYRALQRASGGGEELEDDSEELEERSEEREGRSEEREGRSEERGVRSEERGESSKARADYGEGDVNHHTETGPHGDKSSPHHNEQAHPKPTGPPRESEATSPSPPYSGERAGERGRGGTRTEHTSGNRRPHRPLSTHPRSGHRRRLHRHGPRLPGRLEATRRKNPRKTTPPAPRAEARGAARSR